VYGVVEMDKALNLIGQYLRNTFKDLISFYHREGRFVLVGAGDIDSARIINDINSRFKEPWILKETEMYLELDFVQTAKEMTIESPEKRLDAVLAVLRDKAKPVPGAVYYVQDAEIEQNEREMYIRKTLKWVTENELTEVYLQPIVRADTRKIVGAEALARIKDKDGNRIMPGEFIPVAEQNGAINQMGEQVLKKTCKYIIDNDIEKMGITWINVNLSPMQFMNYGLAEKYNSIVEEIGIDVGLIHLEITEEAIVDQMVLFRQIQIMKERGFKFVLDDYGKGYSNLDRLKQIPFINVKIDMAIVRDYCSNPDSLLPNMVQTFKNMGFTITAEGIETKEMADEMQRIGCDYLQGYLFSAPVPVDEFKGKCAELANTK
jgi:EAL domain-containing protein (putative c-di-GMP-specific phosphodiesterase class I)